MIRLRELPVLRQLRSISRLLQDRQHMERNRMFALIDQETRSILADERYADPRKLNRHEHSVFSQGGEDGIIAEILRRIGTRSQTFVELGVGDGLENNTAYLLSRGWSGLWIEGDATSVSRARVNFRREIDRGKLRIRQAFLDAESVAGLLREEGIPEDFDLLSIDVDRNTYYVWDALREFRPRVVVVEYNATFPPADEWVVDYDATRLWNGTMYFGASLKSYEKLGADLGYRLVGCNLAGANAFFVRDDLVGDQFLPPFTAEQHYEPARYWLTRFRSAHPRCMHD